MKKDRRKLLINNLMNKVKERIVTSIQTKNKRRKKSTCSELKEKNKKKKENKTAGERIRKDDEGDFSTATEDGKKRKTYLNRDILIETNESDDGREVGDRMYFDISKDEEEEMQSDDRAKMETGDVDAEEKLTEDEDSQTRKRELGQSGAETICDRKKSKQSKEEKVKRQELEGDIEQKQGMKRDRKIGQRLKRKRAQRHDPELEKMKTKLKHGYTKKDKLENI